MRGSFDVLDVECWVFFEGTFCELYFYTGTPC